MKDTTKILSQVQFLDKYARWDEKLERRETFDEAVSRTVDYLNNVSNGALDPHTKRKIANAMRNGDVMPSMRLFNSAGSAADVNNISIYNCSYSPLENFSDFRDGLIILGHGTGFGYSVESMYIDKLPKINHPKPEEYCEVVHIVDDSIEGWGDALLLLLEFFAENGYAPQFDLSNIRPAGSVLKTRGGIASGPGPLKKMLEKVTHILQEASGRYLKPIEAHDIMCLVAESIIAGGKRRSAMICLFDEHDSDMLNSKKGSWYLKNPQRAYANISIVINEHKPLIWWKWFLQEMDESNSGEPGVFSRYSAVNNLDGRKQAVFGTNPCGEIILRPRQFCNLSIAVAREGDTIYDLKEKVKLAAIIGTIQSCMTNFYNISEDYRINSEEERLLGVDITGIFDSPLTSGISDLELRELKEEVVKTNKIWAEKLGINPSASVTCIKPGGNSSVLLNTSSGLHPRLYKYYIRRIRINAKSPIATYLIMNGVPYSPEVGQTYEDATTLVFDFPIKSGDKAITSSSFTAIEQLEHWLKWKKNWTSHNPSVTVYYDKEELEEVGAWLFLNQEYVGGLTFLPRSNTSYKLMPKEEITKEKYEELFLMFPDLSFSSNTLSAYDSLMHVTSYKEFACVAGSCEI